MKNMENQTSSTLSIPKDFPETVMTYADVLKTMGLESLEVEAWVQDLAVESTNELLERHGKEWVWQNRVRLAEELELIDSM